MCFIESELVFTTETTATFIVNSCLRLEHAPLVIYISLHHDKYIFQDSTHRRVAAVWVINRATITIALLKRKFDK